MSVVVSDTSPLHYLILCGADTVLPRLFTRIVIPPTVFHELQQPNTPSPVRDWARSLPAWASVQAPKALNLSLQVDPGELEAICLAREINAVAVLMDDRAGRNAAISCGVAVIGTIGLIEQAAARGLLDLPEILAPGNHDLSPAYATLRNVDPENRIMMQASYIISLNQINADMLTANDTLVRELLSSLAPSAKRVEEERAKLIAGYIQTAMSFGDRPSASRMTWGVSPGSRRRTCADGETLEPVNKLSGQQRSETVFGWGS